MENYRIEKLWNGLCLKIKIAIMECFQTILEHDRSSPR